MRTGLSPRQAWLTGGVLAGTALTGTLVITGASDVGTFIVAAVTLAGVAWIVSVATEALGQHASSALTGVLQSTLGNLPEFFVVLFALRAGDRVVAETSLLGSIFANAFLALGAVIMVGGHVAPDGIMRFDRRLPKDTSTLLLLAVFLFALLGLSSRLGDRAGQHTEVISVVGSICLLAVYAMWLPRYLRESEEVGVERERSEAAGAMTVPVAVALLAVGGVAAGLVSDWFVGALEPSLHVLHLSRTFAGLVIAAIAGNAVENFAGVVQANKGKSDLAISLVQNSVNQVAMVLYPVLVLVSLLFATHLTFVVNPVFIGALVLMALSLWQITGDGQAYAFEGAALIVLFAILGLIAFYD